MNSPYYNQFLRYTFQAYHILRRNAHLLITLFIMMKDANIKDCNMKLLQKILPRFNLDKTEEEAEKAFQERLEKCIGEGWVEILEVAHKVATSMR